MLTAQPRSSSSIKHHHVPAAIIRRPEMVTGVGRFGGFSMQNKNAVCFRSKKRQQQVNIIRAMSGCDDILLAAKKGIGNGSSLVAPTVEVKAVISIKKRKEESINVILEEQWATLINGIGRGISMQLISEDIDPVTNSGKSVESSVKGLPKPSNSPNVVEYTLNFAVPTDFGCPGAIIVTNFLDKEFYLVNVVLHGHGGEPLVFPANTWIHSQKDNPESRIIFSNKACLPSQTPSGIKDLRREDLLSLRGSGKGERKMHERIYDYAVYNDLGDPDKSDDLARPTLGGSDERPYPRRCRTGRPPTKKDEFPNEIKITTFSAEDLLKGLLQNLVPLIVYLLFSSDSNPSSWLLQIYKLYNNVGVVLKPEEQKDSLNNENVSNLMKQIVTVAERLLKYDTSSPIKRRDRFDWLRDDQFARQTLAGANAVNIELLKAIAEKRLFIVDYHDLLLPFVEKINSLPAGRKTYASRTVFFYMPAGVLRPIVIELSLPPTSTAPRKKHIFIQGHDSTTHWIWKLAKAHVSSNDFGVHQMVNHWYVEFYYFLKVLNSICGESTSVRFIGLSRCQASFAYHILPWIKRFEV
ncbi:OLC1v1028708C1 [Oldenlandia corymbosa var. corymbosa]|uniref:OLC1v1028708C1 n=1 Tax=Oldenlandia corymbosa var. corymbosa TaxID=529605 RepID=A0AAV1CEX1_OLDCO|nr:OLC1v1028708C1 [Oldenlandia corymbosa var. corymbosa]